MSGSLAIRWTAIAFVFGAAVEAPSASAQQPSKPVLSDQAARRIENEISFGAMAAVSYKAFKLGNTIDETDVVKVLSEHGVKGAAARLAPRITAFIRSSGFRYTSATGAVLLGSVALYEYLAGFYSDAPLAAPNPPLTSRPESSLSDLASKAVDPNLLPGASLDRRLGSTPITDFRTVGSANRPLGEIQLQTTISPTVRGLLESQEFRSNPFADVLTRPKNLEAVDRILRQEGTSGTPAR